MVQVQVDILGGYGVGDIKIIVNEAHGTVQEYLKGLNEIH